ncbi:integrator complex subunit 10 isoform X2 [Lycorma delicatula]|uniref:integrator complex subunit 10 isoform X2 n=1 Tax=Lycorma delicatula TaxID=130591 RepID=UPI003F51A042
MESCPSSSSVITTKSDVNDTPNGTNHCTDEQYLIWCARNKSKEYASKSWLLTAKTLFPHEVAFHFEAYEIEKSGKDVKEAAKCFSGLFNEFPNDLCVCNEIAAVTTALRSSDLTSEQEFLKEMFYSMSTDIQHRLLLLTANRSESAMEHCRLMLLLLTNFPNTTVQKHGLELMDTLITAEKHIFEQNPVNCYRKLLVCNLTPLLVNIELSPKQSFRLLFKSLEFYICYLTTGVTQIKDLPENECKIENPWKNLLFIYENLAAKLGWELSSIFSNAWTKEMAWQKITHYIHCHPQVLTNDAHCRPVVYSMNLLFLNSLHEYHNKIYEGNMILVEIPLEVYNTRNVVAESPLKRAKIKQVEDDIVLTAQNKNVPVNTFIYAFKCWDLFHNADSFEREFLKVTQTLRLEVWVKRFLQDVYLYKGLYKECLINLGFNEEPLKKNIHLITAYFWLKQYVRMIEGIVEIIQLLNQMNDTPAASIGVTSSNVTVSNSDDFSYSGFAGHKHSSRHLHFLYLNKDNILKYVTKLLIIALRKNSADLGVDNGLTDGHVLVLLQLDWPNEKHIFKDITEHIRVSRRFSYSLFMKYIVNIEILEEFMSLSTEHGGSVTLDIMIPSNNQLINQRRMSTRGVDKGAKEDFKMAMRRQTARWNENISSLVMRFITTEKDLLEHCLACPSRIGTDLI